MSEELPQDKKAEHDTDAEKFLATYKAEVLGVLDDLEERALVERFSQDQSVSLSADEETRLADILERFETKIFTYEKPGVEQGAKRVLVTSDNPGSWSAVKPLIAALEKDSRCKGVVAVASGVAGKSLMEAFPAFSQIRDEKTVLGDAIALADREPIDVAIASVSVKNGPESLAIFGGKNNLGAARTYFIFEGYPSVSDDFNFRTEEEMEQAIDGIFCNDAFAKAILHKRLPNYPTNRIYTTGVLSSEGFELDKTAEYRAETRKKLDIGKDAFAVLYLGDVNSDYAKMPGANPEINTETFVETLSGIEAFARTEEGKSVALIVRPHPRDPDKEKLVGSGENQSLPENLSVKNGSSPVSFNGVVYASDVVVSIMSNENMFAPARGRQSIFLAYDDPGMGGQALQSAYGHELIEGIRQMPGVHIASSPEELTRILESISKEPLPTPVGVNAVVANVLSRVLG